MKRYALVIGCLLSTPVWADGPKTPAKGCVTIHRLNFSLPNPTVEIVSVQTATRILGEVGVSLRWKHSELREPDASCIAIQMELDRDSTRPNQEALAYALPFQHGGTQIHVFMDRLPAQSVIQRGELLGHVMAHEIGHVLEGIDDHSQSGVMKARWSKSDYALMYQRSLHFASDDALRIARAFARH
jgi:hypothetical protein